jgi:PKD repeat protein
MKLRLLILIVLCAGVVLASGSAQAKIPTPPLPITLPPPAGDEEPPADAIVPSNQLGECSGWYRAGTFGGRWATESTWWEYACRRTGMSDESTADWVDFYFYDVARGSVYYGEWWTAPLMSWENPGCSYWIDVATSQSYGPYTCSAEWNDAPVAAFTFECSGLSCTFDGSSSSDSDGTIVEYLWYFSDGTAVYGATAQHAFAAGRTYAVSLLVADDVGDTGYTSQSVSVSAGASPVATFTVACSGLRCSFDASGSSDADGAIQTYTWSFGDTTWTAGGDARVTHTYGQAGTYSVTLAVTDDRQNSAMVSQGVSVTNAAPAAAFTISCSGLSCGFNGAGSTDSDGAIAGWSWSFGDGTAGSGATAQHAYAQPGTYTVTLTVTDDGGVVDSDSKTVTLITLTATGTKVKGAQKVELAWTGSSADGFDVYRDGARIATVNGLSFTDAVKTKGAVTYKVCAVTSAICSNEATVTY